MIGFGKPSEAIGFLAECCAAATPHQGFVEAVSGLGIAVLEPGACGPEDAGGGVGAVGHQLGGFPGEVGGVVTVMKPKVGRGVMFCQAALLIWSSGRYVKVDVA